MGLFGLKRDRPPDGTRARVEAWARTAGGFGDGTVLKLNEIVCPDPACPGMETVILIMEPGRRTRACKVAKPLAAIEEADVVRALSAR